MGESPSTEPYFKLQGKGRVCWQPYNPDDGRVGPSYFLRVSNREVFVGQRAMGGIHLSFHVDGVAHLTAPNHPTAEAWGMAEKTPSEWSSLMQFHPGWSRLLHVVHPEPELRHFAEEGIGEVTDLVRLPVGRDMALHVAVLRFTGAMVNTQIDFANALHVATIEEGPDWVLEVMALIAPWPQHFREWADEKRAVTPGSDGKSAVMPGFDRPSPSSRLTKLVKMDDGAEWLYDLAANPS